MKQKRTTKDYEAAAQIVKDCYLGNGGKPLKGGIRAYCAAVGKPELSSVATSVHATLLKLGIMEYRDGAYRFNSDPQKHTDDIISRTLADKKKSQQRYKESLANELSSEAAARVAERIKRDTENLRSMGYQQDETGRWYKEVRQYL